MAPPVRPRLLRIKDSVSQTCVLTAFVSAFFSLFFFNPIYRAEIYFFLSHFIQSDSSSKRQHSEGYSLLFVQLPGKAVNFPSPFISHLFHSLTQEAWCLFLLYFPPPLSLSLLGNIFFSPPRLTLLWPSCSDCPPCALFTVWDLQRIILHRRISRALSCPITCDRIPATRSSVFFSCWAAGDGRVGGGGGGGGTRSSSG